jgi:hypothetical protein
MSAITIPTEHDGQITKPTDVLLLMTGDDDRLSYTLALPGQRTRAAELQWHLVQQCQIHGWLALDGQPSRAPSGPSGAPVTLTWRLTALGIQARDHAAKHKEGGDAGVVKAR